MDEKETKRLKLVKAVKQLKLSREKVQERCSKMEPVVTNYQMKTLEIQAVLDRALEQWRKAHDERQESSPENDKASLVDRVVEKARSVGMHFKHCVDLVRQTEEKLLSLQAKLKNQTERGNVERTQFEHERTKLSRQLSSHHEVSGDLKGKTEEMSSRIEALERLSGERWPHDVLEREYGRIKVTTRVEVDGVRWCLVTRRRQDADAEPNKAFWTEQAVLLRKLDLTEDDFVLPNLLKDQIEARLKSKFDRQWDINSKKFDQTVRELQIEKDQVEDRYRKKEEEHRKYKERAHAILEKQSGDIRSLKEENSKSQELSIELETLKKENTSLLESKDSQQLRKLEEDLKRRDERIASLQQEQSQLKAQKEGLEAANKSSQVEQTQAKQTMEEDHRTALAEQKAAFEKKLKSSKAGTTGTKEKYKTMLMDKDKQIKKLRAENKELKSTVDRYEDHSAHYTPRRSDAPPLPSHHPSSPPPLETPEPRRSSGLSGAFGGPQDPGDMSSMAQMQRDSDRKLRGLRELLTESEAEQQDKQRQVEALHSRIQLLERAGSQQKYGDNMDYLKNSLISYLGSDLDASSKTNLLNVIMTILHFSPEEQEKTKKGQVGSFTIESVTSGLGDTLKGWGINLGT